MAALRPAVFLDRDGTINRRPPEHDYIRNVEDLEMLPGAASAIAALSRLGFAVIVVSNQRGVSRGLVSMATLAEIAASIETDVRSFGGKIDGFFYCPHGSEEVCGCRKPATGLLTDAAARHLIDLGSSWMVGDSTSDVLAGKAAGCRTVLVPREVGVPWALDVIKIQQAMSRRLAAQLSQSA